MIATEPGKKGIMNIESLVPDKLKTIVIEAVGDDYSLYEFLGEVNYAIVSAIGDGNIFDDYLSNRSFVEDEFEIEYYLPEDWEASVKNA